MQVIEDKDLIREQCEQLADHFISTQVRPSDISLDYSNCFQFLNTCWLYLSPWAITTITHLDLPDDIIFSWLLIDSYVFVIYFKLELVIYSMRLKYVTV